MKVLILGAGRIGASVADSLVSDANDITVIDTKPDQIAKLQTRYDLRGLVGNAMSPALLTEAGATDTDLIIAVTSSDETNLAACLLADRLFNIPMRIARVRNSELRNYPRLLKEEGFGATTLIWPEQALTTYLAKLVAIPEALQVLEFGEGSAILLAVRTEANSPMVGGSISELQAHIPFAHAQIIAVFRNSKPLRLTKKTLLEAGDEVLLLCNAKHARTAAMQLRRQSEGVRNLIIAGNSAIAQNLVHTLLDNQSKDQRAPDNIRIIEANEEAAKKLAFELGSKAIILNGYFDDEDMLVSAGVSNCDLFISLSNDDENNILSAMLAKKLGAKRTIALVNRKVYGDLIEGSKIDVTISQTQAALDELVRYVRRGDVTAAYSLRHGLAEVLEIVAHGTQKTSKIIGRPITSIKLPEGCTFTAVLRQKDKDIEVLLADDDIIIEAEDHVIVFVPNRRLIPKIERLFAVDVGFF